MFWVLLLPAPFSRSRTLVGEELCCAERLTHFNLQSRRHIVLILFGVAFGFEHPLESERLIQHEDGSTA